MSNPAPSSATTSQAHERDRGLRAIGAVPHHRVIVLGAGFGGLGMAIRLLQEGERDFVVLEKASDVGGTWRDNTYPGCQCDVASNLYSFSFAPNPDWTRTYAWQGEILDYLRACTDRFGVRPFIRFDHQLLEARWNEAQQRWLVRTNHGDLSADFLVSGHGGLSAPSVPEIPGLSRFEGTTFHSAEWRHDHSVEGERVAVVGTGASAIQVVPSIQPKVKKLTLFQRTPAFIVPRMDAPFTQRQRWSFRHMPFTQGLDRLRIYLLSELTVIGMRDPKLMQRGETFTKRHLMEQVRDPELRKKLTPNYALGCKRILRSDDYYPALTQPNVEVVSEGIREVDEGAVITSDGTRHEVDTIILCTGFKVTDHPILERYIGRDGRSLGEHSRQGMTAYLGTTAPSFPNMFVLSGQYTAQGHTSAVYMLESQFTYVLDALRVMKERDAATFEVKREVADAFDAEMQGALEGTVWNSGCASWYLDASGRNTTIWPMFTWRYRKRTRHFDVASYDFQPRAQPSAEPREAATAAE
ncbi:MAG: flavin-containing monooxygenase [Polyangiales bacterium]